MGTMPFHDVDGNRFYDGPGTFQQVWERTRQPDPGAMPYAFVSLGLVAFTPIGKGMGIRQPLRAMSPPMVARQSALLSGMPTVSGQMIMQPLFDPDAPGSGYTAAPAFM